MSLKPVLNTEGVDIAPEVDREASAAGVDPVVLLALLRAESRLNPRAERWGRQTGAAKLAIARGDAGALDVIVHQEWPDISFGYSQRIVLYHDLGDRSATAANCLAVRTAVFSDPAGDIAAAARRLAARFQNPTCDGTPLSALVCYNAGSDRRGEPAWMAAWRGNVEAYERSLQWAEDYRDQGGAAVDMVRAADAADILWGHKVEAQAVAVQLRTTATLLVELADLLEHGAAEDETAIVAFKELTGLQAMESPPVEAGA